MINSKQNYLRFLISDLISQFGAGMILAVLSWYIVSEIGSNRLLANTTILNTISGVTVSLLLGGVIDKFSPKLTVLFAHGLRLFLVVLAVGILTLDANNHFSLFMLALSNGLGWNIYFPASKSLIRQLTSDHDLIKLNSGAEVTMQIGLFASGMVAGLLYESLGFKLILVLGASLFVVATVVASQIQLIKRPEHQQATTSTTLYDSVSYLQKHPRIAICGLVLYVPFIGANIFNVTLPSYVRHTLDSGAALFGLIDMSYGVAACLAGLLAFILVKKFSFKLVVRLSFVLGMSAGIGFYLNHIGLLAVGLTMVIGFCGPAIRSLMNSDMMAIVPQRLLGRVMTLLNLFSLVCQTLMTFVLGGVLDRYGASYGFVLYTGLMLVGGIVFSILYSKEELTI